MASACQLLCGRLVLWYLRSIYYLILTILRRNSMVRRKLSFCCSLKLPGIWLFPTGFSMTSAYQYLWCSLVWWYLHYLYYLIPYDLSTTCFLRSFRIRWFLSNLVFADNLNFRESGCSPNNFQWLVLTNNSDVDVCCDTYVISTTW